jgi:hypothetical protein
MPRLLRLGIHAAVAAFKSTSPLFLFLQTSLPCHGQRGRGEKSLSLAMPLLFRSRLMMKLSFGKRTPANATSSFISTFGSFIQKKERKEQQ